jgi:hypothetical protein
LAGDVAAAKRHLAEYRQIETGMTIHRFARQRSSVPPDAVSRVYQQENERILEGLRLAGMPDENHPKHEISSF